MKDENYIFGIIVLAILLVGGYVILEGKNSTKDKTVPDLLIQKLQQAPNISEKIPDKPLLNDPRTIYGDSLKEKTQLKVCEEVIITKHTGGSNAWGGGIYGEINNTGIEIAKNIEVVATTFDENSNTIGYSKYSRDQLSPGETKNFTIYTTDGFAKYGLKVYCT